MYWTSRRRSYLISSERKSEEAVYHQRDSGQETSHLPRKDFSIRCRSESRQLNNRTSSPAPPPTGNSFLNSLPAMALGVHLRPSLLVLPHHIRPATLRFPSSPAIYVTTTLSWKRTHHLQTQFHIKAAAATSSSSVSSQSQNKIQVEKAKPLPSPSPFRSRDPKDVTILVVGSTGYIGKFVVRELVKRGFNVVAVARERSGIRGRNDRDDTLQDLRGTTVCLSDVTDLAALQDSLEAMGGPSVDVVVCCLASRSGGVKDSWRIDYGATRNSLIAGRARGAAHFVLLSAICVQKPLLEFQRAKLKFEAELEDEVQRSGGEGGGFTYSIVRPTAFFKSLGGQVETVKDGKPYVMFGDGELCACKPISEEDLASFIADCVTDEDKINKILPIGGPGKALTPLEQGEMLFRLLGKQPKFLKVPIGVMDFAIGVLDFLVKFFPNLEDAAEYGKIGRYYAAESMLLLDPETGEYSSEKTPSYGKDTLEEFFKRVIRHGMVGQELGEQSIF